MRSAFSAIPFLFLFGFVATQGYLVPMAALPVNWAVWPSLPDLCALGMLVCALAARRRVPLHALEKSTLGYLGILLLFFAANLGFVTTLSTTTGEGIKYGAFSTILLAKFIATFWAATQIPMNRRRLLALNVAASIAYLWLTLTVIGSHFGLLSLQAFTRHLSNADAGKWAVVKLSSTVSATHGGTTVTIMVLAGLIAATARYRLRWAAYASMLGLGLVSTFLTGSRQGVVRFVAFFVVLIFRDARTLILVVLASITIFLVATFVVDLPELLLNDETASVVERQATLIGDPFSNEGLAGRPDIWRGVIDTLNQKPWRYVVGTGIGNYVEFRNAAHNMILQMMQDGGVIALVVVTSCYAGMFSRLWRYRSIAWPLVATTAGMLTSVMTSAILYPNLATGWYLGLYFVSLHVAVSGNVAQRRHRPRLHGHASVIALSGRPRSNPVQPTSGAGAPRGRVYLRAGRTGRG